MRKITYIFIICICFGSCKSSKRPNIVTKKSEQTEQYVRKERPKVTEKPSYQLNKAGTAAIDDVILNIVNKAKEFNGVRYKYGGNTAKGMDCSGLICTAFDSENIELPRTSLAMSKEGSPIDLQDVRQGDLLFFQTNKNKKQVNHVGLVVETLPGSIEFIHSTSSKGVIISSLNQRYWNLAFYQARRVF